MLQLAYDHFDVINKEYRALQFSEKSSKAFLNNYLQYEVRKSESSWDKIDLVSILDGQPVAYFCAHVERTSNIVNGLFCFAFHLNHENINDKILSKTKTEISLDFKRFFIYLFKQFNTICFSVIVGHTTEENYDKLVKLMNGRIVGVYTKHEKLIDGNIYDKKLYEIHKENLPSFLLKKYF